MKHRLFLYAGLLVAVLSVGGCGGGGGGGNNGGGGGGGGGPGPSVTATNPVNTANGAALTQSIVAVFSQALNATTVNDGSFTLTGPSGPVNGTVALVDNAVHFTPLAALAFNTDYTARLTTAIQDTAGKPLAADYVWRFNTGHKIAAGGAHTCARLDDGRVKCWGDNSSGQLGLGNTDSRGDGVNAMGQSEMGDNLPPVELGSGRTVVEVVAGTDHTCARLDNGQVKCWGANGTGQLGLGDINRRGDGLNAMFETEMGDNLPPVNLGNGRTAVELVAGGSHTCARLDNGAVKCWGRNNSGELGLGDPDNRGELGGTDPNNPAYEMGDNLPPVELGSGRTAVELVAGGGHTCARLDNGRVKCWGSNSFGKLGLGNTDNRGDGLNAMGETEMGDNLPPVELGTAGFFGSLTVLQLDAGADHTCARLADPIFAGQDQVKCWGLNAFGQLGLGDIDSRGNVANEMSDNLLPVNLGNGRTAVEVVAGGNHTCARLDNGAVKCWGRNNSGQLGLGDPDNRGELGGTDPNNPAYEMGDNLPPVDLGS